jgi:hypothetical protein
MTMWVPTRPAEEDVSDLPGIDPHAKRRRSRRRARRDGLADQTVVQSLEDIRSYRAFERALICSVDPRSVLELALVHRLASLLWRLRRANAIETGLFEIQDELLIASRQDLSRGPSQRGTPPSPTRANGHSKVLGSNGRDDPPASDQGPLSTTSMRPPLGPWSKCRTIIAQCFLRQQIAANRDNAGKSSGPRSSAGKSRASSNAYRHGLSLSVGTHAPLAPQVETLARKIAGNAVDAITLERSRDRARRVRPRAVRRAKVALIESARACAVADRPPTPPQDPDRSAEAVRRVLPDLGKLERYERRAANAARTSGFQPSGSAG